MTDKTDSLQDQQAKGQIAEIVLKELEKAFEILDKGIYDDFRNSEADDTAGQAICKARLDVSETLHEYFQVAVYRGKDAAKELLDDRKPRRVV